MDVFELADMQQTRAAASKAYLEFVRESSMSVGLYEIPAGGLDGQQPHTEDEVYYVISGRGRISVGGEDQPVAPGSTIFVATGVPHTFHDIIEDLLLFVAFGPAEGSRGA